MLECASPTRSELVLVVNGHCSGVSGKGAGKPNETRDGEA